MITKCSLHFLGFSTWEIILFMSTMIAITSCPVNADKGDKDENTLQLVQIIFRHGARNPDRTYPTDPYNNESYWPGGWSQLTNIGIEQEFNLGRYLRKRYKNFINEKYYAKEVYILSSDIDRTIVSADSLLAGFYLPNEKSSKKSHEEGEGIPWKPVPIHTIPKEYDNIIRQEASCPRYQQITDEFKANSELLESFRKDNKALFEYFSFHTGLNITSPADFSKFYDTLVIENYFNYTLPDWAQKVVNKGNSTFLGNFYFDMLTYTPEMKRLRAGPILSKMKDHFDDKIAGKSARKMILFSGHDHTITTVMDTLGVYNKRRPPFSAALILELHKSKAENIYEIKIYYKNETEQDPHLIKLGCRENSSNNDSCKYWTFVDILQPFIPNDWGMECQLKYDIMLWGYGGWIVLILLTIVIFLLTKAFFSRTWCTCNNLFSTDYKAL